MLLVTRCSLETYSLLNEKSLITHCITYTHYHFKTSSLSFKNLLVITSKPTHYISKPACYNSKPTHYHFQNLLAIIQDLLVITSKPTCYHLKTYSLLFKNLIKIHQKFFCDNLANISRLRAAPPLPIVSSPSNFLLKIRDIAFPQAGGHWKKFQQGCSCYFL